MGLLFLQLVVSSVLEAEQDLASCKVPKGDVKVGLWVG